MLRKFLLMIAIGMMVLALVDCKKKDDPAPVDPAAKLVGTWKSSTSTKDGVAQSGYNNFKLTFSNTNYACEGRPEVSPWAASGTWKFGADTEMVIIRDPGTSMELQMIYTVTDAGLSISLNYVAGASRTSDIPGQWVFNFTK